MDFTGPDQWTTTCQVRGVLVRTGTSPDSNSSSPQQLHANMRLWLRI